MTHQIFHTAVHFWISETYKKWKDMHSSLIVGVEHESVIRFRIF
jgi:hypothetical protein